MVILMKYKRDAMAPKKNVENNNLLRAGSVSRRNIVSGTQTGHHMPAKKTKLYMLAVCIKLGSAVLCNVIQTRPSAVCCKAKKSGVVARGSSVLLCAALRTDNNPITDSVPAAIKLACAEKHIMTLCLIAFYRNPSMKLLFKQDH